MTVFGALGMPRQRRHPASLAGVVLAVIIAMFACLLSCAHAERSGLHVEGNRLVDGTGATVILRGVNRSGSEYVCIGSHGFADGPTDAASLAAMRSWGLNAVRIPLNEDCWLGINGAALGGAAYQQDVQEYVRTIVAAGMYAVLDLHWSAPGTTVATGQQPMPDADHAPAFWQSVAAAFGSNGSVIFDLFNEPNPGGSGDEQHMWRCLRDGCQETSTQGVSYQAAGMQALVSSVRGAGATNVIMVGGIRGAQSVDTWVTYRPDDPLSNLAVSQHFYYASACGSEACWNRTTAAVAAHYPVIAGEVGDTDCTTKNISHLLGFLEAHGISYLGWDWGTTFGCQSLITSYAGTPTQPYGQWFHDFVLRVAPPTPSETPTVQTPVATPVSSPTDQGAEPSTTPIPGTAMYGSGGGRRGAPIPC